MPLPANIARDLRKVSRDMYELQRRRLSGTSQAAQQGFALGSASRVVYGGTTATPTGVSGIGSFGEVGGIAPVNLALTSGTETFSSVAGNTVTINTPGIYSVIAAYSFQYLAQGGAVAIMQVFLNPGNTDAIIIEGGMNDIDNVLQFLNDGAGHAVTQYGSIPYFGPVDHIAAVIGYAAVSQPNFRYALYISQLFTLGG